ncbi:MAG: tetratricopeptide repeat protein [Deltaproteobacteria bacterium]|nr:tetratricopeptide repeat protein [Deltaproteobacteria bacterium]
MGDASGKDSQRVERLLCLLLLVVTLAIYQGVTEYEFVNFDDIQYVTDNPHVRSGITLRGLRWAFAESHAGNWHPLTWISHMLDCQLFGLRPGMHHLVNLLFHMLNTVLLFLVFSRATGALWRSAFLAALFAVHPLHVESVAWVSERKDVLSTFFGILALRAYVTYARRPAIRRFVPVLLLFAAGLLSKPMLVTLPFVLLLLDYWPLGRWQNRRSAHTSNHGLRESFHTGLVWEKIPLLLLSALVGLVTFLVQRKGGLVLGLEIIPLDLRMANALISYMEYVGRTIWPAGLAVYYVHPASIPLWKAAGAGIFLLCLTLLVLRGARKVPCLAVGWLWFIGTLLPVIGLLHVGGQAMADRYTYIPGIGLFIMAAWGLPALIGEGAYRRRGLAVSALVVLLVFGVLARVQVGTWKDSITLWKHTLDVNEQNYVAHNMLGGALARQGKLPEAMGHFSEALRIKPDYEKAYYYMGLALMEQQRYDEAMDHFSRALDLHFDIPEVIYDLRGVVRLRQGRPGEAVSLFGAALQLNALYVPAHLNLGSALEQMGRVQEAVLHYARALEIDPASAPARFRLGKILLGQGRVREAVTHYAKALDANPDLAEAHYNMGVVMERQGKDGEAVRHFRKALQIKPGYVEAHNNLGAVLARQGRCREAVAHFSAVLRIQPDHGAARSNLDLCLRLMGKGEGHSGVKGGLGRR